MIILVIIISICVIIVYITTLWNKKVGFRSGVFVLRSWAIVDNRICYIPIGHGMPASCRAPTARLIIVLIMIIISICVIIVYVSTSMSISIISRYIIINIIIIVLVIVITIFIAISCYCYKFPAGARQRGVWYCCCM